MGQAGVFTSGIEAGADFRSSIMFWDPESKPDNFDHLRMKMAFYSQLVALGLQLSAAGLARVRQEEVLLSAAEADVVQAATDA